MKQESEQLWEAYVNSYNKPEESCECELVEEKKEDKKLKHDPKADIDKDGKQSEYEKKRADAINKNDGDSSNDHHICATEVHHEKFGFGKPVFSEHAKPNEDGYVSWYTVQFEHGNEVVNTVDLTVLDESSHVNHE